MSLGVVLTPETWLKAACEDARGRGLPELEPLLQTLARSTIALREHDRVARVEPEPPRDVPAR